MASCARRTLQEAVHPRFFSARDTPVAGKSPWIPASAGMTSRSVRHAHDLKVWDAQHRAHGARYRNLARSSSVGTRHAVVPNRG